MEFEIHQLDLRYEGLRVRSPARDRRLIASLAEVGQLVPIVVVNGDEERGLPVVIDGDRRVRRPVVRYIVRYEKRITAYVACGVVAVGEVVCHRCSM